jgi:hypothetical protein
MGDLNSLTNVAPSGADFFAELASENADTEVQLIESGNCPPPPFHLLDDSDEFYVKIPLREYWELGSEAVREKIMDSIQHYEWIDDFYFMMDLNEGLNPEDNVCLMNLDYIDDSVWQKYIQNH